MGHVIDGPPLHWLCPMSLTPLESLQGIWPPDRWRDVSVVVGVSGGADSVALLHLMYKLAQAHRHPGSLIVAHYNHRLRGAESDGDEAFVCDWAKKLGLRIEIAGADRPFSASAPLESATDSFEPVGLGDSEEAWREQRYRFFEKVACKVGARYVALAHHADDRLETILHHVFRGTGIPGLATLKPFRALGEEFVIARPLLHCDRHAIRDYLADEGVAFREDQSNLNNRFTRNKIRNQLSPFLDELGFIHHRNAVLRLSDHAAEIEEWLESMVEPLWERCVRFEGVLVLLDCMEICRQPRPVQRQLLLRLWKTKRWPQGAMNSRAWHRLFAAIDSPGDVQAFHLPGGISISRSGSVLRIEALKS